MKITLIQPAFKNYASIQPPMGLACLAAVLKKRDAEILIIDANAERLTVKETTDKAIRTKPDVVGVTITTPLVDSAQQIASQIKLNDPHLPIIVGGPHPTIMPEEVLRHGNIDIVVRGEGETTIDELYTYFTNPNQASLSSIEGISYINNGKICHNPPRALISDLDSLPFPAWELLPIDKYKSDVRKTNRSLPIMTSRGCPFGCIFCYKGVFGTKYRCRSAENVVNELEYLINNFEIKEFAILDDNFTLDQKRATKICELIIERHLAIPWCTPNGIRASPASIELFSKMKQAGCYRIYIGAESGNQKVLDYINKKLTLEEIREAFELAKKVGLETVALFMIGNLPETEDTMNETIKFALELDPDLAQFTIATPYPGTEMCKLIEKEGEFLINEPENLASCGGAVFRYKNLTPELVNRKYREAYKSFYCRPKFVLKTIRKIRSIHEARNVVSGGITALRMSIQKWD